MGINNRNRLILNEIKLHYNLKNDADLARFLGVAPNTISNWVSRNSLDYDLIITKCEDINGHFLLTAKGNPWISEKKSIVNNEGLGLPKVVTIDTTQNETISLVNVKASAGYLNGYADPEYIESLPTIYMPGLKGGTHRAFENNGHSMSPTLHHKSISIGRWVENFDDIRDRYVYVVVTKSEGVVVKRVINRISERGQLVLISDNQNKRDYPNIILDPEDVLELWKVRGAVEFDFPEPTMWQDRVNDLEAQMTIIMDQLNKHTQKILSIESKNS